MIQAIRNIQRESIPGYWILDKLGQRPDCTARALMMPNLLWPALARVPEKRMTALTGLRPWSRQRACSWSHVPPFAGFNSKLCLLTSVTATSRLRSTQHSL